MEQGFDFSNIKWILIFVVFVVYKFFTTKSQMANQPGDESEAAGEDEVFSQSVEEILAKMESAAKAQQAEALEGKTATSLESQSSQHRAASGGRSVATQQQRAVAPVAKIEKDSRIKDVVTVSQIGENPYEEHDDKAVDFDLRQAVIMSEILTRKYDE